MKRCVIGCSVQGASHKRSETECQDSLKKIERDDGTIIMAVADGHGSKSCPYSKTGSSIAVNVFCKVMESYLDSFAETPDMLLTILNREGDTKVAQTIDAEWKRRVLKVHSNNKRETPVDVDGEKLKDKVYAQYGTTLVGLIITPTFLFALQIGDGDISYVNAEGADLVLKTDKILGTETHSLCKIDSWKRAVSIVRRVVLENDMPCLFMLSTDGFSNSYKDEAEFERTCVDYYAMIKEHGTDAVQQSLKQWLTETSEMGCGDDITVLMAYFTEDEAVHQSPSEDEVSENG